MNIKKNHQDLLLICVLTLIGIGGFILILIATSSMGAGLSPDSVAYIAAARNILNGHGVTILYNNSGTVPLNLWPPMNPNEINHVILTPPLFPFILSLTGLFGLNILKGARYLNAFLFGFNIFLIGFFMKKITNSIILSILTSTLFLISTNLIFVHYMTWSEPLFITFFIVGNLLLIEYLVSLKIKFLYFSAFFYSLAILTRYAAAILVISGVIAILLLNGEKIYKKIIRSIIFIVISCFPLGVWYIRLKFLKSGSAIRRLIFYPIKIDEIKMMLDNITRWILPGRLPLNIRIILVGIIILIFLISFLIINFKVKNKKIIVALKLDEQKKINISSGFFLISIIVFIFSYLLIRYVADANFDFWDNRHLSPIFISSFILILLILKSFSNLLGGPIFKKISFATISIVILIFISFYTYYFTLDKQNTFNLSFLYAGTGYSRHDWATSETIKELKKFPEDTLIYTNDSDAIYILADRAAYMVPVKIDIYSHNPNNNYDSQVKEMKKELKNNKGILVLFKVGLGFLPKDYELKNQLQLHLLKPCSDGAIYDVY